MPKVLIFSKGKKDLKWGIETKSHCWKCNQIYHKRKKIAELEFGFVKEMVEGYSWREEQRSADDLEFKLNRQEKLLKKLWEKFGI